MSKGTFKSILALIAFAGILVLVLTRLDILIGVLKNFFKVLTPFVVGFVLAYVLNIPYVFFMNKAFVFMDKEPARIKNKGDEFLVKLRKPLSLIVTYVILFAVIVLLLSIIIPQITNSIQGVIDNFEVYYVSFQEWVFKVAAKFGFEYEFMSEMFEDLN